MIGRFFTLLALGAAFGGTVALPASAEEAKPASLHQPHIKPLPAVPKRGQAAPSSAQHKASATLPKIKPLAAAKRVQMAPCNAAPALGRPAGHFGWAGYLLDSTAQGGTPCMFTHWDFTGRPLNGDYTRYFFEITAGRQVLLWPLTVGNSSARSARLGAGLASNTTLDWDNVNGTVSIGTPSPVDDTASIIEPAFTTNQYYAGLIEDHVDSLPKIQIGSVTWTNASQVATAQGPTPVADISIKPPDLTIRISMCCRAKAGAARSQLAFDLSVTSLPGQDAVVNVGTPQMRRTGNVHGDSLAGKVVQQGPGQFHIDLSESAPDLENNMKLLLSRVWIDIPLDFASGKKAILTFTTGKVGIDTIYAALH